LLGRERRLTQHAVRRLVNQMKMPGKVTWPQKPLFSPESPPLSHAEASQRLRVIEQIAKLEEVEETARENRKLLVERLNQVPEQN